MAVFEDLAGCIAVSGPNSREQARRVRRWIKRLIGVKARRDRRGLLAVAGDMARETCPTQTLPPDPAAQLNWRVMLSMSDTLYDIAARIPAS